MLVNWSWRYLSWASGPRVIVGDENDPDDAEGSGSSHGGP